MLLNYLILLNLPVQECVRVPASYQHRPHLCHYCIDRYSIGLNCCCYHYYYRCFDRCIDVYYAVRPYRSRHHWMPFSWSNWCFFFFHFASFQSFLFIFFSLLCVHVLLRELIIISFLCSLNHTWYWLIDMVDITLTHTSTSFSMHVENIKKKKTLNWIQLIAFFALFFTLRVTALSYCCLVVRNISFFLTLLEWEMIMKKKEKMFSEILKEIRYKNALICCFPTVHTQFSRPFVLNFYSHFRSKWFFFYFLSN